MPYRPSRLDLLVALAIAVALALVGVGSMRLIEHDRASLYEVYAEDRQGSLEEAGARVAEGLQDVVDDLAFGAGLVAAADDDAQRREVLSALVGSVRAYRGAVIADRTGAAVLVVGDPRREGVDAATLATLVQQVAREALGPGAAEVEASRPFEGEGWLRVFATSLPGGSGGEALALVVDTEPLLAPLGILAAEQATWAVAVGPHGQVQPIRSPGAENLVAVADSGRAPTLAEMLDDLRTGGTGSRRVPAAEARATGLGDGEALAAWRPITTAGVEPWGAATISSLSVLRAHESSLLRRVGGAGLGAGLLVMAFGAYGFMAVRRTADLADRLRHSDALASLRERAEQVVAHIPSAVLIVDPDGRIVECNPAFVHRFGTVAPASGLGASLPRSDARSLSTLTDLVEGARASGEPTSVAEATLQLDEQPGRYALHAVPLREGDAASSVLLVIDDLTELGRLRTRLVRTEKLATVGVLAAGIAHEIGTPLGVIRGRAEYTAAKLGPDHPQATGLAIIIEQIDRVARIIRGLLDFSRERPGAVGPQDAAAIARRVTTLMQVEAEHRGVDLGADLPDPGPVVSADPDQLEQVLVNLVINALDATDRGGHVAISVDAGGAGMVRIVVADDGRGIPAEDLHRVFDPFFTTKKRGQGTGLGLSVVLQIVRAHGASLELDTAPDRGTRAILSWPAPR